MSRLGLCFVLCSGVLALAVAIAGCSEEEEESGSTPSADDIANKAAESAAEDEGADVDEDVEKPDSCKVLTEEIVRKELDVAKDTEVEQSVFDVVHHTCTYRWEKENAEEVRAKIKKQQQERVAKMMRDMRKGEKVQGIVDMAADMPSAENEVALTLVHDDLDSEEAAQKRFDGILTTLNKGIKSRVEAKTVDEEVEFKAKTERVDGVADGAAWSEKLSQLSVVSGTRIFHLVVKIHEDRDDNRETAKGLANRLTQEL